MITDAMIREQGIDIGIRLMPVANPKPISGLKELSRVLVEESAVEQFNRAMTNWFHGLMRELGQ
ncbi:hypothetical protein [Methylomonas sp. 11b]|uniref:hypothetical protein n=1 Tax=Methylomonas sp. 11b TaxID=1168169 RepID=UPI00047EF8D6|nr:hypothetical protein [Methylomonas sp. 11b]